MNIPYRIVSLWEMLIFHAHDFVTLLDCLQTIDNLGVSEMISQADIDFLHKTLLPSARKELERIGMTISLKQCERMESLTLADSGQIHACARELRSRIKDELSVGHFLHLSEQEANWYQPGKNPFGKEVDDKFSSCFYDIKEAGCCLGLERSTAAAFHSIRCLEAGIRALSRCLQISDPTRGSDRNWGVMLRNLKTAIEAKWPKPSDKMSGDGQLFDEIYGSLAGIQNPYRNATMHLDQKYTPEEAKYIFEMVGGFMKKISSRMDENGLPLA